VTSGSPAASAPLRIGLVLGQLDLGGSEGQALALAAGLARRGHDARLSCFLGGARRPQADPLVCRRRGGPLKLMAYITDSLATRQILDHLDLSPPRKPPPEIRDFVRVPVEDEGRHIEVQPA